MSACRTCGKELKDHGRCAPDDPAMDCGGDCLECVKDVEELLRERRCPSCHGEAIVNGSPCIACDGSGGVKF